MVKWIVDGMMSVKPSRVSAVSWLKVPNGARTWRA
jgi:hypothetical protein